MASVLGISFWGQKVLFFTFTKKYVFKLSLLFLHMILIK